MSRPLSDGDVLACLSAAVRLAGGQRAWADVHGFTQSYVSKVLRGDQAPSPRALAALGLQEMPRRYVPVERGAVR